MVMRKLVEDVGKVSRKSGNVNKSKTEMQFPNDILHFLSQPNPFKIMQICITASNDMLHLKVTWSSDWSNCINEEIAVAQNE